MNELKLKTDQALKEMAHCLYQQIYVFDCFSGNDMIRLELIYNELEKREYNIEEEKVLNITK